MSKKRGRGKSVEAARRRVAAAEEKLPGLREKLGKAEKATGYQSSLERRQARNVHFVERCGHPYRSARIALRVLGRQSWWRPQAGEDWASYDTCGVMIQ